MKYRGWHFSAPCGGESQGTSLGGSIPRWLQRPLHGKSTLRYCRLLTSIKPHYVAFCCEAFYPLNSGSHTRYCTGWSPRTREKIVKVRFVRRNMPIFSGIQPENPSRDVIVSLKMTTRDGETFTLGERMPYPCSALPGKIFDCPEGALGLRGFWGTTEQIQIPGQAGAAWDVLRRLGPIWR